MQFKAYSAPRLPMPQITGLSTKIRLTVARGHTVDHLIVKAMKLTIVLLMAAILQVSARTSAQTVTYAAKDVSLKQVFTAIREQTPYFFVYDEADLKDAKAVTLDLKDVSLEDALKAALAGQPLEFELQGNTVFITRKTGKNLLFVPDTPIRGRVVDELGNTLAGATISLKHAKGQGVATDTDGTFNMNVKAGDILVVSFIGYESIEHKVTAGEIDAAAVAIVLSKATAQLDAVQVVNKGYYKENKRFSTGNVSTVTSKDIEKQPVTSPLMALQGRIPGLDISPVNGAPGRAPKITIRGETSINRTGGYPLYVIDGVVIDSRPLRSQQFNIYTDDTMSPGPGDGIDPLSALNLASIETVEVLKDADATAIYGSRGANGVILITTKQGNRNEAVSLDITASHGVARVPYFRDLLNTEQYVAMRKEAFANAGLTPDEYAYDLTFWDTTRYTDWQKELLGGSGKVDDAQVSLSGGSATSSYRLGGSYHREGSFVNNDFGHSHAGVSFNFDHQSKDKRMGISFSASYGVNNNKILSIYDFMYFALYTAPNAPSLYNEDGSLNWAVKDFGAFKAETFLNPLTHVKKTNEAKIGMLVANSTISYEIMNGLKAKVSLGYTDTYTDELMKTPIASYSPTAAPYVDGSSVFSNNKRTSWIIEPQLSWSRSFSAHHVDALVGGTLQSSFQKYRAINASGYTSDALLNVLRAAQTYYVAEDDEAEYRYAAMFARLGYNFRQKYFLNLTGRKDGSSRFGPANRLTSFGSVGAAWIISSESFMQQMPKSILSFAKLRGSYGISGNDQIDDYRYLDLFSIGYLRYLNSTVLEPSALFNPDYKWESTNKLEAALELGFFQDKVQLQAVWYRNRSSNQLVSYDLPATTGFNSILTNFNATVQNKGWEFTLQTQNVQSKDFSWTTSLNISLPDNRLISFPGIENSPYVRTYKVGEPLSIKNLFVWEGVDPQTGQHVLSDLNGDGIINDMDTRFGHAAVTWYTGGLNNTIRYKTLTLSFLLRAFGGPGEGPYPSSYPGFPGNQPVNVLDRWQKPGDVTKIGRYVFDYDDANYYYLVMGSNYNIVDASYIKLQTLALTYSLPEKWIPAAKIRNASVYIQANNLFALTGFDGFDPETGPSALPALRMITGGIQLKF